mmetsp:Transcript_34716/g.94008  ORF Transcript_34716/g.94008 Transcript_34716/m.94008 type:complete len:367 (-) Transcript_34716:4-1104(-)
MWDDEDKGDEELEEAYVVWGLRVFALVALVAGSHGASAYAEVDEGQCPRAPLLAVFWADVQYLGGAWLAFDLTACAFCLRCWWLLPQVGQFARLVSFGAWCLSLYGLAQYSMQLGLSRCWSVTSLLAFVVLVAYAVVWSLYMVLVDCSYFCCNSLGEAGCDICGWLEPREWPAAGEESDEETGSVELSSFGRSSPKRSRGGATPGSRSPVLQGCSGGSSSARSGTRSGRIGGASASGSPTVQPAVLGKSRLGSRRARGEIRVMRGGEVLYVGRTPAAVKRWARRHLQDPRGVVVVHSKSMSKSTVREAPRDAGSRRRPATPPSPLRPPSSPPSPLRPPPEPGPSGVRSATVACASAAQSAPPLLEI